MTGRKLPNWIDSFYSYTENLPSPALFRKWAGISIVAGALERKVWVRTLGSNLYPNLYTILCGPPGVGKTVLTSKIHSLWSELSHHFVASSSVTKAALIDDLKDAERLLIKPNHTPSTITFNSLLVCSNELGVLVPGYENDFMNTLTDIYDCHPYSERRRTKDLNFKMERPQINLIAATTPSYLSNFLPEGAWDQGFMSRCLMVYSGETVIRDLFTETKDDIKMYETLKADLSLIGELFGQLSFTEDAALLINDWHLSGGAPRPDHPKLNNYNTRRTAHLLKLMMVAAVAESDRLVIAAEHFQRALDWLTEVETFMPDIFKSMSSGGDSKAIEEVWYFAYNTYLREGKKAVAEHRLVHFLQERVPAHNIARILEVMVRARILEEEVINKVGKCYKPRAKKAA